MSNRNRLAVIRVPVPTAGWTPDQSARGTPPNAALTLQNIRVDTGIGRSRPGRVALTVNPPLDVGVAQTGTATFVTGDTALVGIGTLFTSEFAVGDYIKDTTDDNDAYTKILTITDNTNIVLAVGYRGPGGAGVAPQKAQTAGRAIISIKNMTLPDESVETMIFDVLTAYRFINGAWATITGAPNAWTGTSADKFWALKAPFAGSDRFLCSNGFDSVIKVWEGGVNDMADYAGSVGARHGVMGDDSRLFIADTIESSVRFTQRVRWTVIALGNGGATDWTDPGSGIIELRGDGEPITALWKQFGRIYVGKRRSIIALLPTGIALDAYAAETLTTGGDGVFAGGSLVPYGNQVAFMTARDFVLFDGTNTNPLGTSKVRQQLRDRLNKGALNNITSIFDEENNRIGWGLPLDKSATPTEIWWYNLETGAWEFDTIAHTALGPYSNIDITTVDELAGDDVDELSPTLVDDLSPPGSAVVSVLIGFGDSRTEQVSSTAANDVGSAFTARYASGALPLLGVPVTIAGRQRAITPDDNMVLDSVEVAMLDRGSDYTLLVEISKDGGSSWVPVGNVSLTSTATEVAMRIVEATVHKRISVGGSLMVRLSNVTGSAKWGWTDFTAWVDIVGRKR